MPNDQSNQPEFASSLSQSIPNAKNGIDKSSLNTDGWGRAHAVLLSRTIDAAKTMHAFSESRLQTNINAGKSAMTCSNPVELAALQFSYLENTAAQYRDFAKDLSNQIRQTSNA